MRGDESRGKERRGEGEERREVDERREEDRIGEEGSRCIQTIAIQVKSSVVAIGIAML